MFKYFYGILIFLILFFGFFTHFSLAESNFTVSIRVGLTNLTLSGRTSSGAQVTFMENGAVIGTTTADVNGLFAKTIEGLEAGIHNISLYAVAGDGVATSTVNYSISLILGVETTLSNIVLPPTINLSGTSVGQGDTFNLSGLTVASSTVTLFISGVSHSYSVSKTLTSYIDGSWSYDFDTDGLAIGDYRVYAKTSTTDGYQSESSENKDFKVITATTVTPGTATVTSSVPTVTPTLTPGERILCLLPSLIRSLYDPNNNCRIEKEEIFTVVKSWTQEWRGFIKEIYAAGLEGEAKAFQNCDFNQDNSCNLTDLSILLFYIEE